MNNIDKHRHCYSEPRRRTFLDTLIGFISNAEDVLKIPFNKENDPIFANLARQLILKELKI